MNRALESPITHVAFLRAINLGSVRKFAKGDVVAATEGAGFEAVRTHLNTGNVGLRTRMRSRPRIEQALETAYRQRAGFEVPSIVLTAGELAAVVATGDRLGAGHAGRHYVSLLRDEAPPEAAAKLQEKAGDQARVAVEDRAVHLLVAEDYRTSPVTNAEVERLCGVATNRTINVLRTVVDKWTHATPQ